MAHFYCRFFLVTVTFLVMLTGCKEKSEYPRLKTGAWEVTSILQSEVSGDDESVRAIFASRLKALESPRTSRICITGDPKESRFFTAPPTPEGCIYEVTSSNSTQHEATMVCDRDARTKSRSNYKLQLTGDDLYTETMQSFSEKSASLPLEITSTLKNSGRYLGADCAALDAKDLLKSESQDLLSAVPWPGH